jgi:hypothetical protein
MAARERETEDTGSGEARMGCGLFLLAGPKGSLRSISCFSFLFFFSFSVFFISFTDFA